MTVRITESRFFRFATAVAVFGAIGCSSDESASGTPDAGAGASQSSGGAAASTGSGGASAGGTAGSGNGGTAGASSGGATSAGGNAQGGASSGGATSSGGSTSAGGNTSGGNTSSGGSASGGAPQGDSGVALANPPPASKFFVGANFWNIDWEGQDDFFQSGVDFTTTQNPWLPGFLADLAPYHVLRFMDWNLTNDSNNTQAVWTTRKQKTAPQNEPVAFEWQIDLVNRTKKDYWLNVPHESTPDYWTKLATLVHDSLDPSLRVYLEWSNEVWNGGFPQHGYAANQATTLGLPGSDKAAAYYVYASVRVYEAFEAVFGKGSPRLVKVLAGQAAYTGPCQAHMAALADGTINPNGTKPDVYAIAPYFSGTSISALQTAVTTVTGWTTDSKGCASGGGLPLVSYEGGSDSFAASGNGCTTLQHDSGMHDLYTSYFDAISGAGLTGPFMQYTHTGSCWGLKEKTSDSVSVSPKYKGVLDWIAAHP